MRAKAQLKSYEKLSFSITLDAPVEEWRAALKQFGELGPIRPAWPLSQLNDSIAKMLKDLDETHYAVIEREEVQP